MNGDIKDYIGVYKNVYEPGYCQHIIDEFDRLALLGAGYTRKQAENAAGHVKKDLSLTLNFRENPLSPFNNRAAEPLFFEGLQNCYEQYAEFYSNINSHKIRTCNMKVQRTDPGGGYHVWHSEHGPDEHANRVLVYMLYLNTIAPENAGETEFLYQKVRHQPVENTMVLWPASFTHTHRGNTVFGETSKYIITGWFGFV